MLVRQAFRYELVPTAVQRAGLANHGRRGVWLRVAPTAAVRRMRAAVRAGIADVWGAARVPESAGGFMPHVSLAYSNTDGPSAPYEAALAAMAPRSAMVELGAIPLIALGRSAPLSVGDNCDRTVRSSRGDQRAKRPGALDTVTVSPRLKPGAATTTRRPTAQALEAGPGGSGLGKSGRRAYVG
jgi:hypothetical protein